MVGHAAGALHEVWQISRIIGVPEVCVVQARPAYVGACENSGRMKKSAMKVGEQGKTSNSPKKHTKLFSPKNRMREVATMSVDQDEPKMIAFRSARPCCGYSFAGVWCTLHKEEVMMRGSELLVLGREDRHQWDQSLDAQWSKD